GVSHHLTAVPGGERSGAGAARSVLRASGASSSARRDGRPGGRRCGVLGVLARHPTGGDRVAVARLGVVFGESVPGPPGRGLSGRRYTTEPGAALLVPGRGGAVLSAVALAVHVVGACGTPVAGHTPTVGGGAEWAADRFVGAFGGVDRQGSHCGLFLADHACLGVGRGWSARPDPGAGRSEERRVGKDCG